MRWKTDPEIRFWKNVARAGQDDCWPWLRARSEKGYGIFKLDGRLVRAHRLAWAFAAKVTLTSLPAHVVVHHTCERADCCNPNHLEALDKTTHDRIHATDLRRRI